MKYLLATGRIFFGICIAGIGVLHFLYPGIRPIIIPDLTNIPSGLYWIVYLTAVLLTITGLLIVIGKKFHLISLIMGMVFLALFLFVHLPVFLSAGPQNTSLWINLNKILALSGGFFLTAQINAPIFENKMVNTLFKLSPIGSYLFAIMLYNFSVGHILSMNGVSTLVPKYIPFPKFWTFMGGIALMGSAISIFTRYKTEKINLLLAAVLFIWLLSLHLYYAVQFPKWKEGENFIGVITCMAFCGIALVISQIRPDNTPVKLSAKKISATAVCFLLCGIALSQKVQDVQSRRSGNLVIENVNILPLTENVVLYNHDVWVNNGIISKIVKHNKEITGQTVDRINGTGKFLIPAFTDAHVHYGNNEKLFSLYDSLYLHYGVLHVFALNGNKKVIVHRDYINKGKIPGPEIFCSSPPLNDPMLSKESAKALVDTLYTTGYNFLKVYSYLSKEGFVAIDREAASVGLRIIGHIPLKVGTWRVLRSTQSLISHAEEFMYNEPIHYMMGDVVKDNPINRRGVTSIADSVSRYKKAVSPTLIAFASIISTAKMVSTSHKKYERIAKEWNWDVKTNPYARKFVSSMSKRRLQTGYEFQNALVKAFNAKGVLLLAGTDAPTIPGLVPGESLHRELQKLVDAGLSNFEALRAATVNAAAFMGMADKFGTIEVNKEGSFILLNKNPLLAIKNTLSIVNVIVKGNVLALFDCYN